MLTKTMTLFSATLLLAACNSTAQPKPAAPAQSAPAAQSAAAAPIRQAWRLTELSGFKGEIPTNAKMDWTKLPNAYAYMGCNHMNFHAQASKSGSLKLSEMTSTIMLCENNQLEDAFTTAMKRVSRYEINGQTLILRGKNGVQIKFAPAQ
ncbi:META domain-containing protein [Kingella oralis]|uniref:META domain-containing protein n=1 Tax=Kingella oralis TaxID=505 RepID=UPI002D7E5B84|nr:META domain-containing protein [Kingella oralis]